jgi:2,3-dihydroxyphenylpropionate 1,2-dioxygenase
MNTHWERVDHLDTAHRFRNALTEASALLHASKPDAVVVIGSNHFRGFWLDLMPAFTIGVGQVVSSGEHGTPQGNLPSDPELGHHICNGLMGRGFDIAFSSRLTIDHGISHAVQWIVDLRQTPVIPIVPIVVNCFAPPLPSLKRSQAFGEALGAVIREFPRGKRIAVIGTGGLSHTLPFPDWRAPQSENDAFLVDSWESGRGKWQEYETRRRQILVNAPPRLNEDFDRHFLELITTGRAAEFAERIADDELIKTAGNGAAEFRSWLIMAATLGQRPGRALAYSPMPQWLTGMAVAVIAGEPSQTGESS